VRASILIEKHRVRAASPLEGPMTGISFDAFTRRAAEAITRRKSVLALGAAALGAATTPMVAEAGRCGKKVKKKCEKQVEQCEDAVADVCTDKGGEACVNACADCCNPEDKCLNQDNFECLLRCVALMI
jgi:hypothetical protein